MADDAVQFVDFRVDQAGGRFVEQHHPRLAHQQAGEQQFSPVQCFQTRRRSADIGTLQADLLGCPFGVKAGQDRAGMPAARRETPRPTVSASGTTGDW